VAPKIKGSIIARGGNNIPITYGPESAAKTPPLRNPMEKVISDGYPRHGPRVRTGFKYVLDLRQDKQMDF